ncbi:MAG TPA: glutathione S-transferase family protein [Kiloniellaceae bacterium]|nr:glutathione S-transferase family protein [Kiloniellaceae bacterium]HIP79060.1 glutathione S-transferase family protein [Kiloniellaceae bacterium]
MPKLYADPASGNCYKIQLLFSFLAIPYDLVHVDIMAGESRSAAFLEKNPNGRIPLLELDDGTFLPESNAILFYLAEGSPFLPDDRLARARVLQWMFFEQYSHEPYIAVLRFWRIYANKTPEDEPQWGDKEQRGYAALDVLERTLTGRDWLLEEALSKGPTIADIALYAYTHVADQGGFDLAGYPAVRAWLARMADRPGYVAIGQR